MLRVYNLRVQAHRDSPTTHLPIGSVNKEDFSWARDVV